MTIVSKCAVCLRELNPNNKVGLELDMRDGKLYKPGGVPPEYSQGWFPVGKDCAKKDSPSIAFG